MINIFIIMGFMIIGICLIMLFGLYREIVFLEYSMSIRSHVWKSYTRNTNPIICRMTVLANEAQEYIPSQTIVDIKEYNIRKKEFYELHQKYWKIAQKYKDAVKILNNMDKEYEHKCIFTNKYRNILDPFELRQEMDKI